MVTDEKHGTTDKTIGGFRSFLQYLLETAGSYGIGVMAACWLA
jgi:hypothetical protein